MSVSVTSAAPSGARAAWTPERFKGRSEMARRGWDSVTVPGCVAAWAELSARYGKLPFADLLAMAGGGRDVVGKTAHAAAAAA